MNATVRNIVAYGSMAAVSVSAVILLIYVFYALGELWT